MSEEENTTNEIDLENPGADVLDHDGDFDPEDFEIDKGSVQMHVHKNIDEFPDSITMGTPSKLGECKVYFNSADKKTAEERILGALQLRKYMRDQEALIEGIQK